MHISHKSLRGQKAQGKASIFQWLQTIRKEDFNYKKLEEGHSSTVDGTRTLQQPIDLNHDIYHLSLKSYNSMVLDAEAEFIYLDAFAIF